MMTDIWCFTCSHELRREPGRNLEARYAHEDPDDEDGCICVIDGMECEPR